MVMMCGFPCSGKSTRAIELANFLRQYNGKSVPVEESVDKSAESSGCKIKSRMQKGDAEINHLLPMKVFIVNEEELHIDRIETYSEGAREKSARGAIRAALERNLERNVVVIVDYMNNIKGFRYELHHRARSLKTNHCVVCLPFVYHSQVSKDSFLSSLGILRYFS